MGLFDRFKKSEPKEKSTSTPTKAETTPENTDWAKGSNILLVDDAAFIRMVIKDILIKGGYNIAAEADNGVRAVEIFKSAKSYLDLVIMDITMPEMDGITALKEMKKIDPNVPVIMCSSVGQQSMVIESIEAGAKDFIVKPFQPDRVLEAVKKCIG